jgi:hypothetical protein
MVVRRMELTQDRVQISASELAVKNHWICYYNIS